MCIGGIGYESFLDAVLRNTDNPDEGKFSSEFPLEGGAYFDCLSYHNYPMHGLRKWKNGAWEMQRHSDKAVEVFLNGKTSKETVLANYGYDGVTYPLKRVIVTETNVPSQSFDDYIGSEAAQHNYLTKIIIKGKAEGIDQIHTFCLSDSKTPANPYNAMGFYEDLTSVEPFNQKEKTSAVACRTAMNLLEGYHYSERRTQELQLPSTLDGAAFVNPEGGCICALWARTTADFSENAEAQFAFPSMWNITGFLRHDWNSSLTGEKSPVSGSNALLTGSPSFLILDNVLSSKQQLKKAQKSVKSSQTKAPVLLHTYIGQQRPVQVYNFLGKRVFGFDNPHMKDSHLLNHRLSQGIYIFRKNYESED